MAENLSHQDLERKTAIPLSRPYFTEDELKAVWSVMESGWVSKGPKAIEFESMVEDYLEINHAIAVTNCTSALHLALLALGVRQGQRVVISDYTFPATGFAPRYVGADPVLCDINPLTYAMDPKDLELCLIRYDHIAAIIVVHPFGQCADMDKIMAVADKYGVPVIEDAACAFGSRYKGIKAGTIGDIGCFSLHARKGITTGEGGIVVTNNKIYADKMRKLSEFGVTSTWTREENVFRPLEFWELGYNYKMSDITAAIGTIQIKRANWLIGHRRAASRKYAEAIERDLPFLTIPYEHPDCYHNFQAYVPLVKPEFKDYRDWIIQRFISNDVMSTIGTYALHRQPVFLSSGRALPVSSDIFDRAISLPIYQGLRLRKIMQVGRKIWQELQEKISCGYQESYGFQKDSGKNLEIRVETGPLPRRTMGISSNIRK